MSVQPAAELERRIFAILDELERHNGDLLKVIVRDTKRLCTVGEWRIAVENMCSNLFEEHDEPVRLTRELYDAIAEVAGSLQMSPRDYLFLQKSVSEV